MQSVFNKMTKDDYLFIKNKYGGHASWAIWADVGTTPKSNMEDLAIFDDDDVHKRLNPENVLVGLNISGYILEKPFENFHGKGGGAFKIRYATRGTALWGGYLTDIIKDFPEMHSSNVMKYLRSHPDLAERNIASFKQELSDIGSTHPTIYAFGNDTFEILTKLMGSIFRIKNLMHYSHFISKENYRNHVLEVVSS